MIAGRYKVGRLLGCGGMAEVRDGWDSQLDRPVAIKLLHPLLGNEPEMRRRFRNEARAAASLSHPNIVCVFDSGEHAGVPYIVMERLPGTSVADELRGGWLPQARVRSLLGDVLSALDSAHRAGILHRDIKPGNILHSGSGDTVKLADFGIAKALDSATHTKTGEVLGTMAYLSPERIAGAPASISDDLYAVGVVAFESLSGRARFERDNAAALAHAIMTAQPPPISVLRPDTEPALAALIDRTTGRPPGERFASAAEMLAVLHGKTVGPVRSPTKVLEAPLPQEPISLAYVRPAPRRTRRRTKVLAGLGAGIIAVIVVAASQSPSTPTVSAPVSSPSPTPAATTTPVVSAPPPPEPERPVGHGNGKGNGNGNGKKGNKGDG